MKSLFALALAGTLSLAASPALASPPWSTPMPYPTAPSFLFLTLSGAGNALVINDRSTAYATQIYRNGDTTCLKDTKTGACQVTINHNTGVLFSKGILVQPPGGQQGINVASPDPGGSSIAGQFSFNTMQGTINTPVTGTQPGSTNCACVAMFQVSASVGPNYKGYEVYGGAFGVVPSADNPGSVSDLVGLAAGVNQQYVAGSRLYGMVPSVIAGANARAPAMLGVESDIGLSTATGIPYRAAFQAVNYGAQQATQSDTVLAAVNGYTGAGFKHLVDFPTYSTTLNGYIGDAVDPTQAGTTLYVTAVLTGDLQSLNPFGGTKITGASVTAGTTVTALDPAYPTSCSVMTPCKLTVSTSQLVGSGSPVSLASYQTVQPLTTTGDYFHSESPMTIAHWANLPNVTVNGNILSFPGVILTGAGKLTIGGTDFYGTPAAVPAGHLGFGGAYSTSEKCGALLNFDGCAQINVGGSVKYFPYGSAKPNQTAQSAAGTTQATCLATTADYVEVAGAAAGSATGVCARAWNGVSGAVSRQEILNATATTLTLYPPVSSASLFVLDGTTGLLSAGTGTSLAGRKRATVWCQSATLCYVQS